MDASPLLLAWLLALPFLPSDEPTLHPLAIQIRELNGHELVRIGEIHDAQKHLPEALTYYQQALRAFRVGKQRRDEAMTQIKIASILERQGKRRSALSHLQDAASLFAKFPDHPAHGEALLALGRLSAWLGSQEAATPLFAQAVDRFSRSGNQRGQGSARIALGLLRINDGQGEAGISLIQRALADARHRGDDDQILEALVALGDAQWLLDQPDAALACYREALPLAQKRLEARVQADLYRRMASVHEAMGQEGPGIVVAKEAVRLYHSLSDWSGEAVAWALLSSLYRRTGQTEQEEQATQRALLLQRHQQFTVHAG